MTDLRRDLNLAASGPSDDERRRILDRVSRRGGRQGRRAIGIGLAIAGLAAAMIGAVALRPDDRSIGPTDGWQAVGELTIQSTGHGRLVDGILAWDDGVLRGAASESRPLRIVTPEAVLEVEATGFEVGRDEVGTEATLERGRMTVWCTGEPVRELAPGGSATCFRNADAGLGYVLELRNGGRPPTEWLPEVDRALAHRSGTRAAATELRGFRVDGLLSLGRFDEARDTARTLLSDPASPRGPVSAVARRLVDQGDCAGARPFLAHLADQGDGIAAVWLADCAADPAEREWALRKGAADPRPEVRAAVEARIDHEL